MSPGRRGTSRPTPGNPRRCCAARLRRSWVNGASRARTGDLLGAIQALSQLSYSPAGAAISRRCARPRECSRRTTSHGRSRVWRRMGLLDDAIREHLELKRRNGADPSEVAREHQEALDPIFPGASARSDGDAEPSVEPDTGDVGEVAPGGEAAPEASPVPDTVGEGVEDARATSELSSTGQETVELDMQ